MTSTSLRAKALACTFLATALLAPVAAQAQSSPTFRNLDANGVDLTKGDFLTGFPEGSIGSGSAELALMRMVGNLGATGLHGESQWDRILLTVNSSGTFVDWGFRTDKFPGAESRGATVTGSGNDFVYHAADGTRVEFTDPNAGSSDVTNFCDGSGTQSSCILVPTSITSPNGKTVTLAYDFWVNCQQQLQITDPLTCTFSPRLASIANSDGYEITFAYASAASSFSHTNPPSTFYQRTGASFINTNAGTSALASVSYSYPSTGVVDITDTGGRVWRVTSGSSAYAIRRPGASADTTTASVSSGIVTSVTKEGVTTSYSRSVSGTTATMTVTNALSQATTVVSDLTTGRPTSVTDPLSRTTSFTYDSSGRLTRTTAPEGNYVETTYDARGNATQTQAVPKSGSGAPTLTTSASYDSTCSNLLTCNKPNSTTDARGNTTDYSYDSATGNLTSVTLPAPTTGATQPQTRYGYTLVNGAYQVTSVSQCQTGSSCAGTSDEVKATVAYDASGNVTSQSIGAGDASLTATTGMTYDGLGNLLTVDGPLSGTADTTRYRYNAARQVVGIVSPDPDGAGALKNRAVRNTYTNGLLTKTEKGTVDSQSDSDWVAFTSLQETDTTYDANARPATQGLASATTIYALTQTSYDALGRVQCVAQRMSPAYYGSLPSDACTIGTQQTSPAYGPDRIVRTTYDAAGRPTTKTVAYGTATQTDDVTTAYTWNGKVQSVIDGEGNKTSYIYDGLDRLYQVQFPSGTKGAGTSNISDYEQYAYDANGNPTSRRNRGNETMSLTYDALNRLTYKDLPGTEPDVTYTYDLLDRLTGASQTGNALSFTYDALGRNLTQTGPQGTVGSMWDIAGRRTRITHPDGFCVEQDYFVTGELVHIRENGATSGAGLLATYGYDDLGRRASITRGDGSLSTFSYDGISRRTQLADDLAGTSYDLTLSFSYNPASQVIQNVRSNDSYAWTGHYNVNRSYTANGLNQYTASGSLAPTYDSKGNLTSAGVPTYGYSSENLLTSASGGITLAYDAAKRLYQTAGGTSGTTRFGYDGTELIAEYDSSNIVQRRYVHGAGVDEPLVWYEGSGTTVRRFLHTDERGSVIAVTNSLGAALSVNSYDEYGIPSSTNSGRFQFTGQTWLPDIGVYYFKGRIYSPTLGRFLQLDPLGFSDSMNVYSYAKVDPIGRLDPSGMSSCPPIAAGHGACDPLDELREELTKLGIDVSTLDADDVLSVASQVIALGDAFKDSGLPLDSMASIGVTQGSGKDPVVFSYVTVSGGPGGHDSWEVKFTVKGAGPGWIVQEIHTTATMKDGSVRVLKPYWEVFQVQGGQSTATDHFDRDSLSVAQFSVHAEAYFYEGIKLPSTFRQYGSNNTGDALSQRSKPNLPNPTAGPIVRDFVSNFHGKKH